MFRVLGPVSVAAGGRVSPAGEPRPRTLLALLALEAGRIVSIERIVDAVWGDRPPTSRGAVYTCVSVVRRSLVSAGVDRDVLQRHAGGYVLDVPPASVDAHVFEQRVAQARKELAGGRLEAGARSLKTALELWRGTALGGASGAWAEEERARLAAARLAVLEERIDAELALGEGAALVDELRSLAAENPLREQVHGQLMLALGRVGRQAEALAVYRDCRQRLVQDLGVEPGPRLREVFERLLRGETPSAAVSLEPAVLPVPWQIPPDIADFTGRSAETDAAVKFLTGTGQTRVCAVSGPPGVGKSAFATHVAHRVAARFGDGLLFVTLQGTRPEPVGANEALAALLRGLGVADLAMPAGLDDRSRLFRTLTARRNVLVVLDDAADESQVRPLLPSGPGTAAVVTSRRRLSALEGAAPIELRVLGEPDAVTLLGRVAGAARLGAEPEQARLIVRLVGCLPLAVRIAGARLAARPDRPAAYLAGRLREPRRVLDELAAGDLAVRNSLELSYAGLADRECTALRRLGWLGVPEFSPWLVAPLLDVSVEEAEDVVDRLVDARVLDPLGINAAGLERYRLHALIQVFAHERAEAEETPAEALRAVERAIDWWLALLSHATDQAPTDVLRLRTSQPSHAYHRVGEVAAAELIAAPVAWVEAEQAVLVHVVQRAGELGLATRVSWLVAALATSKLASRARFPQWWFRHAAVLEARRRGPERSARVLSEPPDSYPGDQTRFDESAAYYRRSLDRHRAGNDVEGTAASAMGLSVVHRERGDLSGALHVLAEVPLTSAVTPLTRARIHHNRGMVHVERGDLERGLADHRTAIGLYREAADRCGVALVEMTAGIAHRAAGRLTEAALHCERAISGLEAFGNPMLLSNAVQALMKVRIRRQRTAGVAAILRDTLDDRRSHEDGFGQALQLRTLGELALAEGRLTDAEDYLRLSVRWWDALGLPLWRARSLRDLVTTLAARGDTADASATWSEALAIFRRHGSREATEPHPAADLGFYVH
ncbi:NB-ARC domain-containing protein [Amycolatopsis sp. NBC_01488]|uniref:AfsR/SARP family transcriptional regulator n=1 Tax=Amycolatopsis sp. NBC_01488 TaxID=2903563 RepID=UPI002E27F49E|nr:BTAD domain-containing putative transcriptional regulator [Amycolatopsis sp. NBC_01488]